ncbi:hypothetical protein ABIE04_001405 [Rhodanobacter soli]|uniref:Uncharacterized protein n=1 Tax=Rhodanobacter soli TaxID=590609 RepID=A0ABV2PW57_9GAMM
MVLRQVAAACSSSTLKPRSRCTTQESVVMAGVGSVRLTSRSRRTASPPLNSSVRRQKHAHMGNREVGNNCRVSGWCTVHTTSPSGVTPNRLGFVTGHLPILYRWHGLCSRTSSVQSALRKGVVPRFMATQPFQFSSTSSILPPRRLRVLGVRLGGFGSSSHLAGSVLCRGLGAYSYGCRGTSRHPNCHVGLSCQNRTSRLTVRSRRTATPPLNSSVRCHAKVFRNRGREPR